MALFEDAPAAAAKGHVRPRAAKGWHAADKGLEVDLSEEEAVSDPSYPWD